MTCEYLLPETVTHEPLFPETVTRKPLCCPGDAGTAWCRDEESAKPATVTFVSDETLKAVWARERVGDTEHMSTLVRANDIAGRDELRIC